MQLELTDDEVVALQDTLDSCIGDLSVEIRHTDSPSVRTGLRKRRDSLRRVRDRLLKE